MATAARSLEQCPVCRGTGNRVPQLGPGRGQVVTCAVCGGAGQVDQRTADFWIRPPAERRENRIPQRGRGRPPVLHLIEDPPRCRVPHRLVGWSRGMFRGGDR